MSALAASGREGWGGKGALREGPRSYSTSALHGAGEEGGGGGRAKALLTDGLHRDTRGTLL